MESNSKILMVLEVPLKSRFYLNVFFLFLYYNWFQHKVLLAKFCNASTVLMMGCILCAMLHFVQNPKTIVLLCICWWQSQLSLSNFLKPILILCQGDLFLYGTESLICPINRKGSWVGCLGWQRGWARTFFLSNFFPFQSFSFISDKNKLM